MTSNNVITTDFIADTTDLVRVNKEIAKIGVNSKAWDRFNAKAKQAEKIIDTTGYVVREFNKQFGPKPQSAMTKFWEGSTKNVWGFNGALLSTLFFGMEMQRVFGTALKSVFEGYKKIIPESHAFNVMTTKLSANWEFFKFQLADALSTSPIFQKLIEMAIGLVQALQGLPAPMKTFITIAMGIGFVTGAFLKFFGIIGLGVAGIADLNRGLAAMQVGAGNIGKAKFLAFTAGLSAAAAAAWLAVESLDAFYSSSELGKKAGEDLKESWIQTINSALGPLSDALGGVNLKINTMGEFFILLGVTVHNAIALFGMLLDVIIFLVRVIGNLSTSLNVGLTMIKSLASAIKEFLSGNWEEAASLLNPFDALSTHIDQVKTDMAEVGDSWTNLQKNFTDKAMSLTGYGDAIDAYRRENRQTQETPQETTNINVMMMTDALANGTISNEQYNAFMAQTQFQSGN